ncbi:MAG: methionine adenosyltransferase [Candidatus Sulfotelmatobacter sp.]|jgi:S-adenosylmethionine synthetase
MNPRQYVFTSESVSEGHPDKVCDYIADSILDTYLAEDPQARVACEVLCKGSNVILAGEISSAVAVDHDRIARDAIREIGYTDPTQEFHADGVRIQQFITAQAPEIALGVGGRIDAGGEQGAGDQGIMFGYATDETPELMPLPIALAHRLGQLLAQDRHSGVEPWLRPDAKTQVSVSYEGDKPIGVSSVLVSTQHSSDVDSNYILEYVTRRLAPRALGRRYSDHISFTVNPAGSFLQGGPSADCGVTGRKIIVDTYGGAARHGGGAFSGKDPSKVDRSAAYFCRYVARQIVLQGLASRVEIQVAYAIGLAKPVSVKVYTFGTGDALEAEEFVRTFDFRPAAMIERLNLLRPIYRKTTNYGHFGKPGLPWEVQR